MRARLTQMLHTPRTEHAYHTPHTTHTYNTHTIHTNIYHTDAPLACAHTHTHSTHKPTNTCVLNERSLFHICTYTPTAHPYVRFVRHGRSLHQHRLSIDCGGNFTSEVGSAWIGTRCERRRLTNCARRRVQCSSIARRAWRSTSPHPILNLTRRDHARGPSCNWHLRRLPLPHDGGNVELKSRSVMLTQVMAVVCLWHRFWSGSAFAKSRSASRRSAEIGAGLR